MCVCGVLSFIRLFATPWTVARRAPLFVGFSRQEYWSGLLCPPPGNLLDPEMELVSPVCCSRLGSHILHICVCVYIHTCIHMASPDRGDRTLYFIPQLPGLNLFPLPVGHTFPASFAGSLASPSWQMLECYRFALRCIFVYTHFPDDSIHLHGFK